MLRFRSRVLRFRVLGASFSRFRVLRFRSRVLRFRVLGASCFGLRFRFRSRVLRFRVLGASFSRFRVLRFRSRVLRFRVLGASCFGLRFRVLRFRNYQKKTPKIAEDNQQLHDSIFVFSKFTTKVSFKI